MPDFNWIDDPQMSSFIRDATGRCCPDCQSTDIFYSEITNDDPQLHARDYECQNCSAEWSMGARARA